MLANEMLNQLQTALSARFQKYSISFDVTYTTESAAEFQGNNNPTVTFHRPFEEAQNVEQLLGYEYPISELNVRRHPVIELRRHKNGLVMEFILPPDAWWDQENFIGKLTINRHRQTFRQIIQKLSEDFCIGFWSGVNLDDLVLNPFQASHSSVFDQWVSTFCCGQNWFRVGVWYDEVDEVTPELVAELFDKAQRLVRIYDFISWKGSNDYRAFAHSAMMLAYA
jgi:hypothetical protein